MKAIDNNKGQGMISTIGALISLGFMLVIAVLIIGNLEESTVGSCSVGDSYVINSTDSQNVTEFFHGFVLSNVITDSTANGNVTITYTVTAADADGNADCQVGVGAGGSWTNIGALNNVSPTKLDFTAAQMGISMNLNYSTCIGSNITEANITYNSLRTCDYTYDAYSALTSTNTMTYSGLGILPVALVIFAAVAVISTLYLLISRT